MGLEACRAREGVKPSLPRQARPPRASPYLAVGVNVLALMAKGDRRRVGGGEDRLLGDRGTGSVQG